MRNLSSGEKSKWQLFSLSLTVLLVIALAALCENSSAVVASNDGAPDGSILGTVLQHQRDLHLTAGQMQKIESLRLEFRHDSIKTQGDLQLAEIELEQMQHANPVDYSRIEAKLAQIASLRTAITLLSMKADDKARSILTAGQRDMVESVSTPVLSSGPGAQAQSSQTADNQKTLEIEMTQSVASRLLDWAKLFAYFVGVPLALLGIVLGFLGVKTYSDFSGLVKHAREDISNNLEDAKKRASLIKSEAESLSSGFAQLKSQLADASKLAGEVKVLSSKVERIEEKVGFTSSSKLPAKIKSQLESAFYEFQAYLVKVGFQPKGGRVDIDVPEKMTIGAIAYYEPEQRRLVIDSKYASDPELLYREYMHDMLYANGMPNDPNGKLWPYYAIESGLATYFPCSFTGNPRSAEKTAALYKEGDFQIWDLSTQRKFSEIKPDTGSAMMIGTEVWGGAFWDLRKLLGQETADNLLFKTWFALKSEEVRKTRGGVFVKKLLELAHAGEHADQIRAVFEKRGWKERHGAEGG